MRFAYFPGCSVASTARHYGESVNAVAAALGIELVEVDDWNCCGATAYMSVNEVLSFCLCARNLSQATRIGETLVTPCSACFTNLRKTEVYLAEFPQIKKKVDTTLAEAGMKYDGGVITKHFLQAMVEDVGLEAIRARVTRPLSHLRVAPYYGCQIARPFGIEDDCDNPTMLDRLLAALGASVAPFAMKTACCGGSLIGTREEVALRLCRNLLLCARQGRADCIAVTCPICQVNLDAYQASINRSFGTDFSMPVVYFTQLMGLAFGLTPEAVGLHRCVVPAARLVPQFAEVAT